VVADIDWSNVSLAGTFAFSFLVGYVLGVIATVRLFRVVKRERDDGP